MDVTEHLIRGSDNVVTLTLTEDGSAISSPSYTQLDVFIGSEVVLSRNSDGAGIALSSAGVLTIRPGELSEDLSALVADQLYRVQVVLTTSDNDDGAVFGGDDAADLLYFKVSDLPSVS